MRWHTFSIAVKEELRRSGIYIARGFSPGV
jgi:hypothetical protein